jgi:hypothetical protein
MSGDAEDGKEENKRKEMHQRLNGNSRFRSDANARIENVMVHFESLPGKVSKKDEPADYSLS